MIGAMLKSMLGPWVLPALVAISLVVGLAGGWWLRGPEHVAETAAPAIHLSNATVLERQPVHAVPPAILSAAREVKGAKLQRAAAITVRPAQPDCKPITIELGTLRMRDGTQRVLARSDQGAIVAGIDIPIGGARPRELKWAAGALYDPANDRYGMFVDRDIGRLRFGLDALHDGRGEFAAVMRLGIRF